MLPANRSLARSRLCAAMLASVLIFSFVSSSPARASDPSPPARTPTTAPAPAMPTAAAEATAGDLASAMDIPEADVVSASLGTSDPRGAHVFDFLGGFATAGESFAAISSGDASQASLPSDTESLSTVLGGLNTSQGNDLVQLTLVLRVPPDAQYWAVDWQFLTEEFPESLESSYSDAFLLETPASTFTISDGQISAPNNVAVDPTGQPVNVNTSGAVGMSEINALGTTYDGATTILTTVVPIPLEADQITLVFSVMDLLDSIYDTTVFLDNFRFLGQQPPATLAPEITVPVKWCALEGSPAAKDTDVLLQRTQRADDNIWSPKARISYQSSIPNGVRFEVMGDGVGDEDSICDEGEACSAKPPVIRDPDPGGPGCLGDILTYGDGDEWQQAVTACASVWSRALSDAGYSASTGLVAVNANKILNEEGKYAGVLGLAGSGTDSIDDLVADMEFLAVTDNQYTLNEPYLDSRDLILAHETGHTLSLPHFQGSSANLMYPTFRPGGVPQDQLTRNANDLDDQSTQVGQARGGATRFIGASWSQRFETPIAGDAIWPVVGDLPESEAFVNLAKVAVRREQDAGVTIFYALTSGPLPDDGGNASYWFLLDLDNNPATGAPASSSSAEMGVTTTFEGAEYLLKVQVLTTASGGPQASAIVKRYQIGSFIAVQNPSIQAIAGQLTPKYWLVDGYPDPGRLGMPQSVVGLQLNSVLFGPLTHLRMAGVAQDANTGVADFTEAKQVSLALPPLPRCSVTPGIAQPGERAIVTARNLIPYAFGTVLLGSNPMALVSTDGWGNVVFSFDVPTEITGGDRRVSVVVNGTNVAAECSLFITHPPVFDVPPSPEPGAEFTVYEGQLLAFTVQASDPESEDTVTLGAATLPYGASFTSTDGNPATGAFSWTPDVDQTGVYVVPLTAVDDHGAAARALAIVVNVLMNEAPMADAGGPYTVPEGGSVVLSGSGSDPDCTELTYAWDLNGDGTFETAGQNVTFSAVGLDGPSTQIVDLEVCDDKGACESSSAEVEITNVAPTVSSDRPEQSIPEGAVIEPVTVSATDLADDLPFVADTTWTQDDGDEEAGLPPGFILTTGDCIPKDGNTTCNWTLWGRYTLAVPAEYIVTVFVTDKDGDAGSTEIAITIGNHSPTADAGSLYTVVEGAQTTVAGTGSDADNDALTYSWDLNNDGIFETPGQSVTFSAVGRDGPSTQTVVLRVCDDKGSCRKSEAKVTITNAAPLVSSSPHVQSVQYSDSIETVTVSITDVNGDMPLAVSSTFTENDGPAQPGLPNGLKLTAGGCTPSPGQSTCAWQLTGKAIVTPASYIIAVAAADHDGARSSANVVIVMGREDARVTYTGTLFAWASMATPSTAEVTLAATIRDIAAAEPEKDADPGDIRNATVAFVNRGTGATLCTRTVSLVNQSDTTTGTATCNWLVTLTGDRQSFTIGTVVGNYYFRDSSIDDITVTVSKAAARIFFPLAVR